MDDSFLWGMRSSFGLASSMRDFQTYVIGVIVLLMMIRSTSCGLIVKGSFNPSRDSLV